MSLHPLIKRQRIEIDDHNRDGRIIHDWNDPNKDIHIHKRTNYKIKGKRRDVDIKIPINSDREYTVLFNGKTTEKYNAHDLIKEIKKALDDRKTRNEFTSDVIKALENFNTHLTNEDLAGQLLDKLSKHFDLNWTKEEIATYRNDALVSYTRIYKDNENHSFFATIDTLRIVIGERTKSCFHQVPIFNNNKSETK
jgi:hypothetical protein